MELYVRPGHEQVKVAFFVDYWVQTRNFDLYQVIFLLPSKPAHLSGKC